jgi:hypothetical protein
MARLRHFAPPCLPAMRGTGVADFLKLAGK